MRRIGKSRNELLETIDRPALNALPTEPYSYAEWKRARVAPDYHIEVADHYYSVPSKLIREMVEARITSATVEVFHKGPRREPRVLGGSQPAHDHHRAYAERASPLRGMDARQMMSEADLIGPAAIALVEAIMRAKPHPEQGFRSCLGILGLVRTYGSERSKPRAGAATISARPPTARSSRSCSTVSTEPTPTRKRRTARRSGTPTSVVVATTTDALIR